MASFLHCGLYKLRDQGNCVRVSQLPCRHLQEKPRNDRHQDQMLQHVNHLGAIYNHVTVLQQWEINHVDDAVRAFHIRSVHLDPAVVEQDRIA